MALSKKKRNILLVIVTLVILGLVGGAIGYFFVYNKPHRNYEKASVDFKVTSNEIFDAFESDEKDAFHKYQNKVVEVTGPIESVNEVQDGITQVVLIAENAMLGGVKAQLHAKYRDDAEYAKQVSDLENANATTLKCRCVGMDAEVVLDNCFITSK